MNARKQKWTAFMGSALIFGIYQSSDYLEYAFVSYFGKHAPAIATSIDSGADQWEITAKFKDHHLRPVSAKIRGEAEWSKPKAVLEWDYLDPLRSYPVHIYYWKSNPQWCVVQPADVTTGGAWLRTFLIVGGWVLAAVALVHYTSRADRGQ